MGDATGPASPAVVQAVMDAMDCLREVDWSGSAYCGEHLVGWLSDVNACARAERVANVAAAATLREAADALDSVGHHWSGAPSDAFFEVATDLRACAGGES